MVSAGEAQDPQQHGLGHWVHWHWYPRCPRCQGGQRKWRFTQACYLDLAMSVLILSTFFCFSFSSSGLRGVSGSRSMYRSGMRTLSGVESYGGTEVTASIPCQVAPFHPSWAPLTSLLMSTS